MHETLDVLLPSWFAISNSALKGDSLKKSNFYWNHINLYSNQNGCGHGCNPYTMWLPVSLRRRVLSGESLPIIAYAPPNWSTKWQNFGLRQVCCMRATTINKVSHMQHFVPYATVCLQGSRNCTHGDERARNVYAKNFSRARNYVHVNQSKHF